MRHRTDGPAVMNADGSCRWYLKGRLHRVDGPAIEAASGAAAWYQRGQLHRDDGPAVEGADGTREWYLRAIKLSEEEFNAAHGIKPILKTAPQKSKHAVKRDILSLREKYLNSDGASGIKIRW